MCFSHKEFKMYTINSAHPPSLGTPFSSLISNQQPDCLAFWQLGKSDSSYWRDLPGNVAVIRIKTAGGAAVTSSSPVWEHMCFCVVDPCLSAPSQPQAEWGLVHLDGSL